MEGLIRRHFGTVFCFVFVAESDLPLNIIALENVTDVD